MFWSSTHVRGNPIKKREESAPVSEGSRVRIDVSGFLRFVYHEAWVVCGAAARAA